MGVVVIYETPASPGSPFSILLVVGGGEPTPDERAAMAKRIQELATTRAQAFKWSMGTPREKPVFTSNSQDGGKEPDIIAGLERLAPTGNIIADAINAEIAQTSAAVAGDSNPLITGEAPVELTSKPQRTPATVAPITIKPGESLLEAARRTLKEQQAK
jgi:hypothetical protein